MNAVNVKGQRPGRSYKTLTAYDAGDDLSEEAHVNAVNVKGQRPGRSYKTLTAYDRRGATA